MNTQESFEHCERITGEQAKNFAYGMAYVGYSF